MARPLDAHLESVAGRQGRVVGDFWLIIRRVKRKVKAMDYLGQHEHDLNFDQSGAQARAKCDSDDQLKAFSKENNVDGVTLNRIQYDLPFII